MLKGDEDNRSENLLYLGDESVVGFLKKLSGGFSIKSKLCQASLFLNEGGSGRRQTPETTSFYF